MAKRYDKQFKLDSVQYSLTHPELSITACARNMNVSTSTLSKWIKDYKKDGDLECRGSGNYSSDEAKEIARLKRELRDTKDALDVLKKAISILGE